MKKLEKYERRKKISLRNQKLAFLGYVIPMISIISAKMIGLASFAYYHIVIFVAVISVTSLIFYLIILLKKNLTRKFTDKFLVVYYINWLGLYWYMTFFLAEIRIVSIIFVFIALIFLLSNATFILGVILTSFSSIVYLSATWVGIQYFDQPGTIKENLFYLLIFFPVGIFIAYMSDEFTNQREGISNAKRDAEKALDKTERERNELETITSLQEEFLSNLSHELRTPLSAIYGYSEIMCDEDEKELESLKSYGKEIHSQAEKLMHYIDDLMLIANIETKPAVNFTVIKIKDAVTKSLNKYENIIKEKKIKISITIPIDLEVSIDEAYFYSAIDNIIKNAVIFNRENGQINIYGRQVNGNVELEVKDTGIGIPSESIDRIWDKFYRADSSLTYEVSGVGIGLFLAKRIIELHNGTVSAESVEGKGASFTISLPAVK